jgi:hypothetical protein
MPKKHIKKQVPTKRNTVGKSGFTEKRQRHYAFGFLVGEY